MEEGNSNFYKPSGEDTKKAYEELLCVVEHRLGGFDSSVIKGVADIVLWILKCDDFETPIDKKAEIEKLLNPIADQMFEQLLLMGERITDYSIQVGDAPPYSSVGDECATMETRVAYDLLFRVYRKGPFLHGPPPQIVHRRMAHEMLLILKNESLEPIDTQRNMIRNLLLRASDCHAYLYILVYIVSKLFPEFVRRWDKVVLFSRRPATILASSTSSSSIEETNKGSGSGEEDHHQKVIDTLLIFSWLVPLSSRFWDDNKTAEKEDHSGGFKESENELRRGAFPSSRDHPQLSLSRKGGDRSVAVGKASLTKIPKDKKRRRELKIIQSLVNKLINLVAR